MHFVLIIGPQAVGKMTVGQALARLTDFVLFHNHVTIELVRGLLSLDKAEGWALAKELRMSVFRHFARSGQAGMIYTGVWAFDEPGDRLYYGDILALWREECPEVEIYIVELEADLATRLARNRTENRLLHKPSKRDFEWSDSDVRESDEKHRLNSLPGEITEPNYLRLNNTNMSAGEAAQAIVQKFKLAQSAADE
ncbi:MAG: AAA family ATPase [Oscillospiraceae bacterium]|nr:AAA family ATPase [Oscillospiraceae bacterium]